MIYTLIKDHGEVRIVTILIEIIQFSNYEDVFTKVKAAISDFNCMIVLDLSKVKFMDSISLGMLVPLLLYTRRLGGDMVLVVKDEKLKQMFNVLQLGKILRISDTVEEAVGRFEEEARNDGGD
ncbi:MAG: STAS domain-containing protein [bacterium]